MGNPSNAHRAKATRKVVIFEADAALVARLDLAARATQVSRSWLMRAVLQGWLDDKKLGVEP
jgi:predicted transcriptional regulator